MRIKLRNIILAASILLWTNGVDALTLSSTITNRAHIKKSRLHASNKFSVPLPTNPFESFLGIFQKEVPSSLPAQDIVESFLQAVDSRRDPEELLNFFDNDIKFVDGAHYKPIVGKDNLRKHFYLNSGSSAMSTLRSDSDVNIVVEDVVASGDRANEGMANVCVIHHLEQGGSKIQDSTSISFFSLRNGLITQVIGVTEPPSPKPGDRGLKLLKLVSSVIGDESIVMKAADEMQQRKSSVVEQYFDAWNRRDMKQAASLFTESCSMRDFQYDEHFSGREAFEAHLQRVNDSLPRSFNFVIDGLAASSEKVGVTWHVENQGEPLAFTRGCSFYVIDKKTGLIQSGYEIPEKAPPKLGAFNTLVSKFEEDPIRWVPATLWIAYMYILFFSDGILPGANALQLEQRTWEEVRDLSLNFFLVSPMLHLPFAPVVHPMLEGVFNLLLAWAAMFAGFLSDERKNKPNLLPFGPILVGMQFLTSGFLLPYLVTRSRETAYSVYKEDIDGELQAKIGEWRPLGIMLGSVGLVSIIWGLMARPEFGNFSERYQSFADLLSIDRVGSSFLVDLVIFAAFQSWFIDDDLQRRGIKNDESMILRNVAKYIPFFGLAYYLTFRPALPDRP